MTTPTDKERIKIRCCHRGNARRYRDNGDIDVHVSTRTSSPIRTRPCASSLGDMPFTTTLTALETARFLIVLIALSSKERRAKGFTTKEMAPSSILLILSTSFRVLLMNPAAASIMETTSSFSVSASLLVK
jgi:hypothetical protein